MGRNMKKLAFVVNELYNTGRAAFLSQFGKSADTKRPAAWVSYGYPDEITFTDYLNRYERDASAHGAVHKLLEKCWSETPRIKLENGDEKESPWEAKLKAQLKSISFWHAFANFDRMGMVGRYSGLIYRIADGQEVSQPAGDGDIVDVVPCFEDQLRVTAWDSDLNSPTYGMPAMFQFRTGLPQNQGDTQAQPEQWQDIHPSRVQILAEGSTPKRMFDGIPFLRAGYNSLVDMEKISGGSGESFLKNSARSVVVEFDNEADVAGAISSGAKLEGDGNTNPADIVEDQVKALNRNQDSAMMLQGAKAYTLQTTLFDPSGPWTVAANQFSASVQIPFTILFGQQTGRLASDQDQKDFANRAMSRIRNVIIPALSEFISRAQAIGWIDAQPFEIECPDLNAMSDKDKFDIAFKMSEINAKETAQGPAFTTDEIRQATGYDALTQPIEMPPEGDPAQDVAQ